MKVGLFPKMLFAFLVVSIIPVLIVGGIVFAQSKKAVEQEAIQKLESIRESKTLAIQQHIEEKMSYLDALADNEQVTRAFVPFIEAFEEGGITGQEYESLSSIHDDYFLRFLEEFGFYDVFFIDQNGNVVYTAAKEADLGANLYTGELKDSGLSRAFEEVQDSKKMTFVDYMYYAPSDESASFFAVPYINKETGEAYGVLALQLAGDRINELMAKDTGLGETGTVYLIGPDQLLRSDLREQETSDVGVIQVDTKAATDVINGKQDVLVSKNMEEEEVLTAFSPVVLPGMTWGIITEVDTEEIFAGLSVILKNLIYTLVITIVLVTLFAYFFAKRMVRPIHQLLASVKAIAKDDLTKPVTSKSKDEIGELSIFFEQMRQNLMKLVYRVRHLSGTIDTSMQELVGQAEETRSGTQKMAATMTELASAANEQSRTFALHTESLGELTETIQKTAENSTLVVESTSETEKLADGGVHDLRLVTDQVRNIQTAIVEAKAKSVLVQQAAKNVSTIVSFIESIANETNLLSLNASIEAARAGEKGKGFAVVADEIRKLASQSKQSMEQAQGTIDQITTEIAELERSMENGTAAAQEGVLLVGKATQSFHSIVSQSKGVVGEMLELSAATEEVTSIAQELATHAEQLRVAIEDSAVENEAASARSLHFSERMNHVHQLSANIAELSEGMEKELQRYKLDQVAEAKVEKVAHKGQDEAAASILH